MQPNHLLPPLARWRLLIVLGGMLLGCGNAVAQVPTSSVLAEGNWHRVAVDHDGVYRLDRQFLESHGIITAADSLNRVHVYGSGAGMLPQSNDAPLNSDLRQLTAWQSKTDDYLLFYGQGPARTYYDADREAYRVEKHLYDTANYYFITRSDTPPAAMVTRPHFTAGSGVAITERLAVYHHELEQSNLLGSGRRWLGEEFTAEEPTLDITLPAAAGRSGTLEVAVGSRATARTTFEVSVDGVPLAPIGLDAATKGLYGYQARAATEVFALSELSESPTVSLRYQDRSDNIGYLDYLTLNVREPLAYRGRPLWISNPQARRGALHHYTIALNELPSSLQLWDVTDPAAVAQQEYRGQDSTLSFRVRADTLRQFLLFNPASALPPRYVGPVANQNLLALVTPDLLIVTATLLQAEAERLAQFRRQHDSLRVAVVTLPQIYHAFSGGRQDVTAVRNFIRHLYRGDADSPLRYVLLFGDATYDYRRTSATTVPTYQSRQSLHNVYSYASDDYFGLMDAAEGYWPEQGSGANGYTLEVGIGRLPVNTPEEARTVVDKLIHYATAQGPWRQEVLFVADDGDANKHQHQSDFLASWLEKEQPQQSVQRLFMDAYPQEENRAPAVRERLNRAVERGVGLVDFIGHGGETAWTNEQILDLEMIEDWRNYDRLPVLVTATCEFGRYDDPRRPSGAEAALLSADGGAIAVFTTSRPVFTSTNFQTSTAFYEAAFGTPRPDRRLGDIMRVTKNRSVAGALNRNFVLLGDPSMRYAPPSPRVTLTALTAHEQPSDTLRPLDRVRVQGQVADANGALDEAFSGTVFIDLLAAPREVTTLGQEGDGRTMTYQNRDFRLFRGQATVRNGRFVTEFVLPKNTVSTYGAGKFTFYAQDDARHQEASGAYPVVVGGDPDPTAADNTPPSVALFFNREGQPVPSTLHPNPTLIVRLEDEHGINLADEAHGLRLVLDEWQEFSLNDDYEAALNEPGRGRATFRLPDLVEGTHTLRVRASDTYLNTTERSLSFRIVGDSVLLLQNVVLYPNPTAGAINLSFTLGDQVALGHAELQVYTPQGTSVYRRTIELVSGQESYTVSDDLPRSGAALPGLYLYRLTVYDAQGAHQQHSGKLLLQP